MGTIFAKADAVLVSLGPHEKDSKLLLSMLQHFYETTGAPDATAYDKWAASHGHAEILRFYRALYEFVNQPYWHRVWVVQELMVAQAIYIACGDDLVDWFTLSRLRHFRWQRARLIQRPDGSPALSTRDIIYELDQAPMWSIAETLKKRTLSLEYIVTNFSSWLCANPLDKVYGFLHVIDWSEGQSSSTVQLMPDYSKSTYDLMLECMDSLIWKSQSSSLDAWGVARHLMTCLGLYHMRDRAFELLAERREVTSPCPHLQRSLSLGWRVDKNPSTFGKFGFWNAARLARHGRAFTTAIILTREEDSVTHNLDTKDPKIPLLEVTDGLDDWTTGFVCAQAADGDILLQPLGFGPEVLCHQVCLVVRECPALGIYEIIGHATVSRDYRFCHSADDLDTLSEMLRPLVIEDSEFEGVFCKEDVLAHLALTYWHKGTDGVWDHNRPRGDVTRTRFTATRFSSFVIRRDEVEKDGHDVRFRRTASCPDVTALTVGPRSSVETV